MARSFHSLISVGIVLLASTAWPEDMYLSLDDGSEIVLHDDYTWNFKKSADGTLSEDVQITLDDGVTVVVTRSGEWGYGEDMQEGAAERGIAMHSAYATSMSKQPDAAGATIEAHELVAKKLANQLIAGVWGGGMYDTAKVVSCVQSANKSVSTAEKKVSDGWRVDIRAELDRQAILAIFDCVEKVE